MSELDTMLDEIYESFEGSDLLEEYMNRHEVESLGILTVTNDEEAALVAGYLQDRVSEKVVVEIGGGIGLLALHLSMYAKHVYVIEANPAWTHIWMMMFMARKPKNVTFIFGAADEMKGQLHADVALFCTHSSAENMRSLGEMFAPEVIDVYGEIVPKLPDGLAELDELRK